MRRVQRISLNALGGGPLEKEPRRAAIIIWLPQRRQEVLRDGWPGSKAELYPRHIVLFPQEAPCRDRQSKQKGGVDNGFKGSRWEKCSWGVQVECLAPGVLGCVVGTLDAVLTNKKEPRRNL